MAGEGQLAGPVRIGLGSSVANTRVYSMQNDDSQSYLDEKSFGKPIRQHVKEFGGLFGLIAMIFIAWALHKRIDPMWTGIASLIGVFFLYTGYFAPSILHPIWKGWMSFAHVLGIVMTTLILTVCWSIMLVPMAMLLKIVGKKVMDTTFDPALETYWVERKGEKHDFQLLEKQY